MTSPEPVRETTLYAPVKAFLEGQGYVVKGEVGAADLVAVRGDEPPVIVELKTGFSLALFHQGIARQAVTDAVYLAVPEPRGGKAFRANLKLARMLGLGVITVRLPEGPLVVQCDPGPYRPRKSAARQGRLLREFARRVGDPNDGGSVRRGLVTSYRQDALKCLSYLSEQGPARGAAVAKGTGVEKATRLMADDHYGWFERVERGVYGLTPKGREALGSYAAELDRIAEGGGAA